MVSNDDFDDKATHSNCFYLHINFEQKYPEPAIVNPESTEIENRSEESEGGNLNHTPTFL